VHSSRLCGHRLFECFVDMFMRLCLVFCVQHMCLMLQPMQRLPKKNAVKED
jgi:hypothetical protein